MKLYTTFLIVCCLTGIQSRAQLPAMSEIEDTATAMPLLEGLGKGFFTNPDSTVFYAEKLITYAKNINNDKLLIHGLQMGGEGYRGLGNFPRSLKLQLEALNLSHTMKDRRREAFSSSFIGFTYLMSGFYTNALNYLVPSVKVLDSTHEWIHASFTASNAANCYTMLGKADSAEIFNKESARLWELDKENDGDKRKWALRTLINDRIGANYELKGDLETAKLYYRKSLHYSLADNIRVNISRGQKNLARLFMIQHVEDSAIYYAREAMNSSRLDGQKYHTIDAAFILDTIYRRKGNADSALYYQTIAMQYKDSVYGPDKFRDLQLLMANEQDRLQKAEQERIDAQNRQRLIFMALIVVALAFSAFILRRGNRIKQKLNSQLQQQKTDLEITLARLKETQSQLIQSEKMASLGELTAGIAHEIQNPLNFVNNFAEVNKELISELKDEASRGNINEVKSLASAIEDNDGKIILHGKRADAIVKSMLQHSRSSGGQKEPTDINALCEEYLRLAYYGMRSKDPAFKAELKTHFDPAIGKSDVNAQEMGRVIQNLLNNALYAIQEKQRSAGVSFQPELSLSTRREPNSLEIEVKDNGGGIPDRLQDKIFQPFFTTKPTGQGTGLGLSLSYDIIKAHGGELRVESKEGEGSAFRIILPLD